MDPFGLGLLAGGLGLIAFALASERKPAQGLVIGGVDLSNVDTSKPFTADFSLPATASGAMKSRALQAAREAMNAFAARGCLVQFTELDAVEGRIVILVTSLKGPIRE